MEIAYVDGSSTVQHMNGYLEWRVMCGDDVLACFYGPMSLSAAATFCKALNSNKHLTPIDAQEFIKRES